MTELAVAEKVCTDTREIFGRVLSVSGCAGTAGTCLHASILLQQSLERFDNCETGVRGGDGDGDGGTLDPSGAWHGHYWVEGVTSQGHPFVADITADQFG